jgi:hypothetical protein
MIVSLRKVLSFVFVLLSFVSMANAQQSSEAPLTNASIIRLVKAGFKEKTIIAIIGSRPNQFKVDTDHLIQLKHNGVAENIILAMMAYDPSFSGTDDWDDDKFFKSSGTRAGNGNGSETNIFGSSGGSRSQSESRGTRGGNQNDGSVNGSATVRIIRPPAEAGATAKLERTPTLNNGEVIRLVAAGFSEGTIIKRIENSPADYDLSPSKLEELHKNRVTDPIITAMATAMGDREPSKRPNP